MAPCVGYFTVKKMDLREKKKKVEVGGRSAVVLFSFLLVLCKVCMFSHGIVKQHLWHLLIFGDFLLGA